MNPLLMFHALLTIAIFSIAAVNNEARSDFFADLRGGREYTPAARVVVVWLVIGAAGLVMEVLG